ncbi:MAG: plasmid replication protein RepC [Pseudotabrizicola sp.]|uniref:plasmid replication protein RepC n=1 Tax=Pseudotabrizicola sp. TaxID=2939647 RepID=UPI0027204BE2|nr:plasmid replication protein RepC [Pseudotabrizicola sp.]MDO9641262.1 plasmid replication protein RepC [Pseudotabrizicola sp.]
MEQIATTPMLRHVRRPNLSSQKPQAPTPAADKDNRWHILDLAKTCRRRLKLRDRDIAVLRGLLSLLPSQARPDQMVVFASNRVLIDRCDGIDERTLRRRIAHLQDCGMVERRTSPNGKRYQVRDDHQAALLTYGIDLAPLFHIQSHLEAMAEDCRHETVRIKVLRSLIRDVLFKIPPHQITDVQNEAQRALRRVLDSNQLQKILTQLEDAAPVMIPQSMDNVTQPTTHLSVSDGQNDRHIQSSYKDNLESEEAESKTLSNPVHEIPTNTDHADITVDECMDLARTAREMSPRQPQCWEDLIDLSTRLAPAIGLQGTVIREAEKHLGKHGCALAVLGLVEAFGRVRNPEAYLTALVQRRLKQGLDLVRMFRSLVRPGKPVAALA